jgi:hypothetical protein
MSDIDDLIRRLEAAAEGSEELDALVIAHLVGGSIEQSKINGRWCLYVGVDGRGRPRSWEPRTPLEQELYRAEIHGRGPTRSLDGALTLVPEGYAWDVESDGSVSVWRHSYGEHRSAEDAMAATPALAVCIAALRARAAP